MPERYDKRDRLLRLFLAIDLVSSTAFKAKRPIRAFEAELLSRLATEGALPSVQGLEDWASILQRFFNEFIEALRTNESRYWDEEVSLFSSGMEQSQSKRDGIFEGDPPVEANMRPWKILGDEIVFVSELRHPRQLYLQVRAFWDTMVQFDDQMRTLYGLGVKGRIWTAGFPVRNRPISFSSTAYPPIISRDLKYDSDEEFGREFDPSELNPARSAFYPFEDFIGIDMDIGFRLSSVTSPGRLAVSVEPLYFLAKVPAHVPIRLFHLGWTSLKGIYDERPYPVVWCDFINDANDRSSIYPYEHVDSEYSKVFFDKNKSHVSRNEIFELAENYRKSLGAGVMVKPYIDIDDIAEEHLNYLKSRGE